MEYTLKEEILDKLEQIEESIAIIQQRIKGYQTVDEMNPWVNINN